MNEFNVVVWPIEKVKPYEKNTKKHPEDQVAKLARAIQKFGWDQPIVVDKNGEIIKGHGRRLAAIKLGLAKVPVVVRGDLDEDAVRAARISDNQVAISEMDNEALQFELQALNESEFDLASIGFDGDELDSLLSGMDDLDIETGTAGEPEPESEPGPGQPAAESGPGPGQTAEQPDQEKQVAEQGYEPRYELVIECTGEEDQETLFDEMTERGKTCRVLTI